MISSAVLQELKIPQGWLTPLDEALTAFEINNTYRIAAFLGQCGHESAGFTQLQENLNYSAEAISRVWHSRFPTIQDAQPYAKNPEKLANSVYAGRMGNGPEASGDGYRYRGRGLIQITGKSAYASCMLELDVDCLTNPDVLLEKRNAAMSAGWFWRTNKLNYIADAKDWETLTRRINGGTNGLEDRVSRTELALAVLARQTKMQATNR